MEVIVMDLDSNSTVAAFKELPGPCLSVALCPNATKVAASCGNGSLYIWELQTNSLLKEISCFPKVNSFANAKNLCRLDFYPIDGKYLAYPKNNSVILLNTDTWNEEVLNHEKISADYSVLQFSYCGKYLAAASVEGDFAIWNVAQKSIFTTSKHESSKPVCGLNWSPRNNGKIVYTDIEGQLSIMSNCSKMEMVSETNEPEIENFTENEVDFGDVNFDDADEDNENAVSVEKLKQQYLGSPESELKALSEVSSRAPTPRPRTPEVPLQDPFMPSSTPEHLDPRYLCYNEVGVIKSYGNSADSTEMASKTIEIEFHDSTFHNSIMLQNYQEYTMGAVSKGALVVANNNQIMVIPMLSGNKEWNLKVEEYEEIILVASSENLVCFATSGYIIRVCSVYGTQRGIVSVPGPLVSMSAYRNVLLVAYHSSGIRNKDQCINIKLFEFKGTRVECHDLGSALGPESTLFWLGFSDSGTPGMMDSLGMLSLYPPKCNTWIPFCDTTRHRKSPADGFFVTSVFETYQALGGIKCKGSAYPGFIPKPTLCELPLEPPFAEISTEKTQMEMSLYTWSNLKVMDTDKKFKETALKTFALACKNDLDQRALEVIEIIGNAQILNLGLKYASKLNKRRLAEKLMELAGSLQAEEKAEEDSTPIVVNSGIERQQNIVKPQTINRLSLSKLSGKKHRKFKNESQVEESQPDNSENNSSVVNTQESLFSESESIVELTPKNPFLKRANAESAQDDSQDSASKNPFAKRLKNGQTNSPLSLTDKFAGLEEETPVNSKAQQNSENGEKRKLSDSDTQEKQVEKQRKLDKFMFSKR
ncbi:WD repeat and HMG-box DNA-binding protein 1 isoform X2 [Sitophilus oryzae]|nr:WD repeat and HMG-box DNA-binding protein 1 isoform X2 [Sitophilus oryzae]XP_030761822.1 WD repeat and HMG-box DNA-binding protein 1 isoform X2 [Sitophilus oryzae]